MYKAYLFKAMLSFCLEHLTNSIASARDWHSIPFTATISSPTAMAWERSALPPGVTWNKKSCLVNMNISTIAGPLVTKICFHICLQTLSVPRSNYPSWGIFSHVNHLDQSCALLTTSNGLLNRTSPLVKDRRININITKKPAISRRILHQSQI